MRTSTRCLYIGDMAEFNKEAESSVFAALCDRYHGEALTTTREAWKEEIAIMKRVLSGYNDGQIVFEYDFMGKAGTIN